jgi:hypothetical protein
MFMPGKKESCPMFVLRPRDTHTLLLAVAALLVSGCLEREETVHVERDGSVDIRVEIRGDPGDFATGDVLPERRSGWQTRDWTTTNDKGEEKQHREARLHVAAGKPLPDSFVDPSDPNYETALLFPTELVIERRRDGTYYHFKRVYVAREQARYEYVRQTLQENSKAMKQLSEQGLEALDDQQRAEVIGVLRAIEALKYAEYVRAGAEALEDDWPQDHGLILRRAVLEHFQNEDPSPVLELLAEPAGPERDAAIDEYASRVIAAVPDVLRDKMKELRMPRQQMEAFFAAFDEEQARRAVTEDLADDSFKVRVTLPGQIVAHNATEVDGEFLVWQFPGKALMDRDQILMATSRVTHGARGKDVNR